MLRKNTRQQVPWTSMAILLLSCPNPRNGSIIQRAAASTVESNVRPLRRRIVGSNDESERSQRQRRPREERTLQKESMSSNLLVRTAGIPTHFVGAISHSHLPQMLIPLRVSLEIQILLRVKTKWTN
jgi:hypothetical protein